MAKNNNKTVGVIAGKSASKGGVVPFSQLPNWLLPLPISGDAKMVYCFLHSLAMKFNNNVFPEVQTVASAVSISRRSVFTHLRTLEEIGAIERTQRRHQQRQTSNVYQINFIPPADLGHRITALKNKQRKWKPGEIDPLT